ncbi:MAG: amidohydrolase [Myxococcales bacterium]|nr:amidohydrolase [Myxococcales bacterium]
MRAPPRARAPHAITSALIGFGLALAPACAPKKPTKAPAGEAKAAAEASAAKKGDDAESPAKSPRRVLLLRGARVMTAAGAIHERADLLIEGEKIAAIGPDLAAPAGAEVIDVAGKTITPGIIDTHSHMGVYPAPGLSAHADGNEAVAPNTAYARAADGYWPQDPQLERARAGGVTTAQILPGSANLFGGRTFTIRLIPDARSAEDARFPGAPEGLKIACGENPKRVYGQKAGPQTRMGNVHGHRDAFQKAVEYRRSWQKYEKGKAAAAKAKKLGVTAKDDKDKAEEPDPPARDFALETLVKVMDGEILVHNHCYRADEMSIMLELAESYGFKIRSFHHAVEAYKIADRLAAAGTAASVWADWWGFKAEAYDGVRENAAMLSAAGAKPIIHSDSAIGIQRLNQEAAKAMYSGRRAGIEIADDEALKWITLYPAWALGIDARTGSLEVGKLADVVVWSGSPWSVYTHAERVYIDGALVYERGAQEPRTDFEIGLRAGDIADGAGEVRP